MSRKPDPDTGRTPIPPISIGAGLSLGARLRAYFLAGVLVTAPIAITFYLAWLFVSFIDDRVSAVLPPRFNPETYLPFSVPGLGVVIVFVVLTFIGSMTAGFLGRLIVRTPERLLARMPVVRTVYGAVKQILETVLAHRSSSLREVVLVEYPRRGAWRIGFVTGTMPGVAQALDENAVYNVFIPNTPNVTAGLLVLVPAPDLVRLDVTVEEGLKMVVSGGIVTPSPRAAPGAMPVSSAPGRAHPAGRAPAGEVRPGARSGG